MRYGDLTVSFQNGRPPSWICWARIGTTHDDLVVSIVFYRCAIFCFFGGAGDFAPKMGNDVNETPKRHTFVRLRVV